MTTFNFSNYAFQPYVTDVWTTHKVRHVSSPMPPEGTHKTCILLDKYYEECTDCRSEYRVCRKDCSVIGTYVTHEEDFGIMTPEDFYAWCAHEEKVKKLEWMKNKLANLPTANKANWLVLNLHTLPPQYNEMLRLPPKDKVICFICSTTGWSEETLRAIWDNTPHFYNEELRSLEIDIEELEKDLKMDNHSRERNLRNIAYCEDKLSRVPARSGLQALVAASGYSEVMALMQLSKQLQFNYKTLEHIYHGHEGNPDYVDSLIDLLDRNKKELNQ